MHKMSKKELKRLFGLNKKNLGRLHDPMEFVEPKNLSQVS